jgi:hypothetical protein
VWLRTGQYLGMVGKSAAPSYEDLLTDIRRVRSAGAGTLRTLRLPALRAASVLMDLGDPESVEPAPIDRLLRDTIDRFEDEQIQTAASYTLGLLDGTGRWSLTVRREHAGSELGITGDTFRKKPEQHLLEDIAEEVLKLLHEHQLRAANLEMATRRHPADSRLAVQWVERFEAYYRIWTPVYALAADLEAALTTYLDEPAEHYPWDPTSVEKYDPVDQARGYARNALYRYSQFLLEIKRFKTRHGGLWLFSDPQIEEDVSDAVYRIGWHNSFNEEDDAWLRRHLADSRHEETDAFWQIIRSTSTGNQIYEEWQVLVAEGIGKEGEERSHSQVWLTIDACRDYNRIVDEEWLKINDWYRPTIRPPFVSTAESLYRVQVTRNAQRDSGQRRSM